MPKTRPMEAWTVTAGGRQVNLLDPDPETIDIDDIAHHLAQINRYTGGCRAPLSVAQHSVLVSYQCRHPLAGLLHDAHETYLNDLSAPLKAALRALGAGEALEVLAKRFDWAIGQRFGVDPAGFMAADIKLADQRMVATEQRDLTVPNNPRRSPATAFAERIEAWDWVHARVRFKGRFLELTGAFQSRGTQ